MRYSLGLPCQKRRISAAVSIKLGCLRDGHALSSTKYYFDSLKSIAGPVITNMSKISQSESQRIRAGHLLILGGCNTKIKNPDFNQVPAFEVYNYPEYVVLRNFLKEKGWPPGLIIKIISAKHGIINATKLIEPYDKRLDKKTAEKIRPQVMRKLNEFEWPASVFININKDCQPAISDIATLFGTDKIKYSAGVNGKKLQALKQWLHNLPNEPASDNSSTSDNFQEQSDEHRYLYFFPDWADYVYEPFCADETDENRKVENRKYAHEVFADDPPYDGLLLSLAQLRTKNGHLNGSMKDFREEIGVPDSLRLFGDCGAFSYIKEENPPLSCEEAASLYNKFGFDFGASVDHIPVSSSLLSDEERAARMNLTAKNAEKFLEIHRSNNSYKFNPVGSIQGITPEDYADFASEYIKWGYKHIALGGLVRRQDSDILKILAAVRETLQEATRGQNQRIWVHLFGILRPKLQPIFQDLGVSSFDSASYLRKAWASPDRNYLTEDGTWYGSIRIPFSTSKAMREAAESNPELSNGNMQAMEEKCLLSLSRFDDEEIPEKEVKEILRDVNKYSECFPRKNWPSPKKSSNHLCKKHEKLRKKHEELLMERPWEKCECKVCQEARIHVVIFRGAHRNRRRGFHNTWVFYHKILHGKRKKS